MNALAPNPKKPIELAGRTALNGTLRVSLYWQPWDDATYVTLQDDSQFTEGHHIPVELGQNAMDVFNHPYAYLKD